MASHAKRCLLLGVAGHIDHGKTAIVRALTGTDTDRLPEERRRKISIDLGFACLNLGQYQIGVVDVPGHHRFIRNMLAGAAGVDMAVLVVAANDGVMPQTREHLEILQHLRVRGGVIALSKCDLVDQQWLDLVQDEIRETVSGTFFEDAAIVRTSTITGRGLETLRDSLTVAAENAWRRRPPRSAGRFLMAVDRSLGLPGHGTVATGYVVQGQAASGDELEALPSQSAVRVRELQSHSRTVELVEPGMRAAVKLAGIHYKELSRGDWIVTRGTKPTTRFATVELTLSSAAKQPLKTKTMTHLHVGASDVMAKVILPSGRSIEPGERCFAQLMLSEPTLLVWGQPFIIRRISPAVTLGGGRVLAPRAARLRKLSTEVREHLIALAGEDPLRRLEAAAYVAGYAGLHTSDADIMAGIINDELANQLQQCGVLVDCGERLLHHDMSVRLEEKLIGALQAEHESTPLRAAVEFSRFAQSLEWIKSDVFNATITRLIAAGNLVKRSGGIALNGWLPQLSQTQTMVLDQALALYEEAQACSPSATALAEQIGLEERQLLPLLEYATERGDLVRLAEGLYIAVSAMRLVITRVSGALTDQAGLRASDIRQLLGIPRRVAVPVCEYLDKIGVTQRRGNLRYPGPASRCGTEWPPSPS